MRLGVLLDREHHEPEDRDPEQAEQRLPDLAVLHERIEQDAQKLAREQHRRRFPLGVGEHAGTVGAGPDRTRGA